MNALYNTDNPQIHGFIGLLAGIVILFLISQRKFNRRGVGGLQHFNNYFVAIITLFIEWLFKWAAYGLIIWGLFKLFFG